MYTPIFRASQTKQQSSQSLSDAPLDVERVIFDDGSRFDFYHLATDNADKYQGHIPSVCCIVRIVAVFCPYFLNENGDPTNVLKPTYFEPSWFSCHIFWSWFPQVEIMEGCYQRALLDICRERIIEYLSLHEEPFPSEEYDPIVLEIC